MIIGVHTSIKGGITNAVEECKILKTNALQLFLHSPRSWSFSFNKHAADLFKKKKKELGIKFVAVHSSYLINPLSENQQTLKKSVELFKLELLYSDMIAADAYVIHIRGNKKKTVEENIQLFYDFVKSVGSFKTPLIIENSASAMGSILSNLRLIYERFKQKEIKGFCLDTAHLFEAGYDIRKKDVMSKISNEIEIEKVVMIHMNDSKTDLSSHTDRHHHIGMGEIGVDGFKNFFSFYNFSRLPVILETPKKSLEDDIKNLTAAKKIINNPGQFENTSVGHNAPQKV